MKLKLPHILLIIIGVLLIVMYFVWTSNPEPPKENKKITAAKVKIEQLENKIAKRDSVITLRTKQRDHALDSVRTKVTDDETLITKKYDKVKSDILRLNDDASIELLRDNLGAK